MVKKSPETPVEMTVSIKVGKFNLSILGRSPLIYNSMNYHVQQQLLLPTSRKTAADRAATLKHNPIEEYRDSVYKFSDDRATRLYFPGVAFKKAMATAALDIPGQKKAKIGRLVWINEYNVEMFGVPELYMKPVRMADINRTPDIRTRAILPKWACRVSINFVRPIIKDADILGLMGAAGLLGGIGDGRQERGTFNFGQFEVVDHDDEEFGRVIDAGGRAAQDAALESPKMHDAETEQLFTWFHREIVRREGLPPPARKRRAAAEQAEGEGLH